MNTRTFAAVSLAFATSLATAATLPKLNIDPAEISVSGLSSGGYMAVQYHAVYSASTKGAGIIAAGPYHCAGDGDSIAAIVQNVTNCTRGTPDAAASVAKLKANADAGLVDAVDHLGKSRVYLFIGTRDSFVSPPVMESLANYYKALVPAERIKYLHDKEAEHAFLTDNPAHATCTAGGLPAVNNCGYDQAGDILQWIYDGKLNPRKTTALAGKIVDFEQKAFGTGQQLGLEDTGYAYIPAECASGERCKLHVVFHGCGQSANTVFDNVYGNNGAGYNRWADSNRMVILYPQVGVSYTNPPNPFGCWDWWGYSGPGWDTKQGKQLGAVRAMVEHLVGK
ncbi:MAG: hypothetical protein ACM3SV_05685 [Betaproteobacteria bacterium]